MTDDQTRQRSRHVVVFGVDGVRFDTVRQVRTPHLDAVAAAGFLAPVQVNAAGPTISGPSWATVASGVLATTHGIFGNDLRGHRLDDHPDFLTRVQLCRPGSQTYAAANWPPLVSGAAGGPIFRTRGYQAGDDPDHDLDAWDTAEDLLAADAAKVLGSRDVAAAFVYFGGPDAVAHERGVGPDYVASVEATDLRIGQVLEAVRARPDAAHEDWTVIVVTDHGHVDAGGHGGDSPAERTAWIAACGPSVPTVAPTGLEQADVHAAVLTALGITLEPAWELTGRPFGNR